jgi:polysaccharide biosynthesis/export protein
LEVEMARKVSSRLLIGGLAGLLCSCASDVVLPKPLEPVQVDQTGSDAERDRLRARPQFPAIRLAAGDRVAVHVFGEPELTLAEGTVLPDGSLGVALVGSWPAQGKSPDQLAKELTRQYSRYLRNPRLTVRVLHVSSYRFTVVGAVEKPGCYPFAQPVKVTEALAQAGGLRNGLYRSSTVSLADLSRAYVARSGKVLPVNFIRLLRDGDLRHDIYLSPGDLLYVPSSNDSEIFVLGRVARPRAYLFRGTASLIQVITHAGGLTLGARTSEVRLVRGGLTDPQVFVVDLDAVLSGEAADVQLQAGDIVHVPATPLAQWNDVVKQILPTLEGLARVKYLAQ